jgi:hypothetical protein
MAAELLLDHVSWRLAGPEAGNANARREFSVGPFHGVVVALGLDLYLQKDLALG